MSPKGSILIIDDEQEIRESLEQLLRLEGYQADSASTADEGLKRIEGGVFDLVLLDINLPDHNGLDLLKSIKHDSPEVGVIMITAYDSSQMAFQAPRRARRVTSPSLGTTTNYCSRSATSLTNRACKRRTCNFAGP